MILKSLAQPEEGMQYLQPRESGSCGLLPTLLPTPSVHAFITDAHLHDDHGCTYLT